MGLLDPEMALAAGLLGGGNFGQALGRGMAASQAMQMSEQERKLREAQAQEYASRAQQHQDQQRAAQAQSQRDAQFQSALQQGATPSQLAQYFPEKVDLLKKLAEAPNFGRQAVARTAEVEGPNGAKMIRQLDQYGQPVSEDMAGYVAPQGVNLGNKYVFAKPVAGQSLEMGMSPSERDASARGWASNNLAQQRFAFDKQGGADGGKPQWNSELGGFVDPKTRVVLPALDAQGNPLAASKVGSMGAKVQDAKDVLGILDMVDPLLKKSTGSYAGAAMDAGARVFGVSTSGAQAAAELQALQGALIGKMPKMTGPQSDKDVQLYREMAGQIGDPTLPVKTRQAAANTVRMLNEKYAGGGQGGATGDFSGSTLKPKQNGWSIQKVD